MRNTQRRSTAFSFSFTLPVAFLEFSSVRPGPQAVRLALSPREISPSTSGPTQFTTSTDTVHQWTTPFHLVNWPSPPVDQIISRRHLASPPVDHGNSPRRKTQSTSGPPFLRRELGQSTSGLWLLTSSKGPVHQWTVPFHLVERVSPLVDQRIYGVKWGSPLPDWGSSRRKSGASPTIHCAASH
jgi:hypothetical protein